MKRQNNELAPVVQVVRSDEIEPRRPHTQADMLEQLVQQKVVEILAARDEFVFEPWFRTRQVSYEIRRLQTVPERKKWSLYFERYGCLSCHKQDHSHASSGLCTPCHGRIFKQLKEIVAELMNENLHRST
jgi:hypothetical protein